MARSKTAVTQVDTLTEVLNDENTTSTRAPTSHDIAQRRDYISAVHGMFRAMGLTEDQAETVVTILSTDHSVSHTTRANLVRTYKDCLSLQPFVTKNDIVATAQKAKYAQFWINVHDVLPLHVPTAQLEESLAKRMENITTEKITAGLLRASGLDPEKPCFVGEEPPKLQAIASTVSTTAVPFKREYIKEHPVNVASHLEPLPAN